jgi:hypothetical protein
MPPVDRLKPTRGRSSESSCSLMEFMREFPDDDACLEWLWRNRFSPDGETAHCPKCKTGRGFKRYQTAQRLKSWRRRKQPLISRVFVPLYNPVVNDVEDMQTEKAAVRADQSNDINCLESVRVLSFRSSFSPIRAQGPSNNTRGNHDQPRDSGGSSQALAGPWRSSMTGQPRRASTKKGHFPP